MIHLSNADYLRSRCSCRVDEALALVLALRTRCGDRRDRGSSGDRLRVRPSSADGRRPGPARRRRPCWCQVVGPGPAEVSDGLQRGSDSIYLRVASRPTTRRQVDPLQVFVLDGYGYLEAWCSATRYGLFQLDRIAAVEVTDRRRRARRDPAGPERRLRSTPLRRPLVTSPSRPARCLSIAELPNQQVTPRPDGRPASSPYRSVHRCRSRACCFGLAGTARSPSHPGRQLRRQVARKRWTRCAALRLA